MVVVHKAVAVNEWCGKISMEIYESCPHCGPRLVESIAHMFCSCPLAQHGWRYATNIIWQLFANKRNLGPHKSYFMMQCLFDHPLCKTLKQFNRIWFFLRSGLPWTSLKKTREVIWDTLQDYGRIEWKRTLNFLEEVPDVAYQDVLNEFNSMWGSKTLLWLGATHLPLGWIDHIWASFPWCPLGLRRLALGWLYFGLHLELIFSICAKRKEKKRWCQQ